MVVDGEWSRLFFLSWWLLAVLVMFNLLIALFLQECPPAALRGRRRRLAGRRRPRMALLPLELRGQWCLSALPALRRRIIGFHSQSLLAKAATTTTGAAGAGLAARATCRPLLSLVAPTTRAVVHGIDHAVSMAMIVPVWVFAHSRTLQYGYCS